MNPDAALPLSEALITQHHWATDQLLQVCAALPEHLLQRSSPGGFGTIRATLLHMILNDVGYLARIDGRRPPPLGDDVDLARLRVLNDWVAVQWRAISAGADAAERRVHETEGSLWCRYPLHGLLLQAYQHGCEHRTQICTTLTEGGITPPDLSVWAWLPTAGWWEEGDNG